ncbi:killer cell lectin-like receptor [Cricetulus griseus]|uniref:Killer cell lectin-like receptor n=1 Tax=Cricetulus griseus TaxID=10029 RepID=A0A061HWV6_CRIGR|nr:killer cell lectin-like receptor [Cricetulus griseus]
MEINCLKCKYGKIKDVLVEGKARISLQSRKAKVILKGTALFCLILGTVTSEDLMTVCLLRSVFQCNQENHELKKTLKNLHQEFSTMKNDSNLREEMLKNNKCIEFEALRKSLDSFNRKQNRCFRETKVDLVCKQPPGKCVEAQGFCCGIKCYYLLLDKKSWNGCKYTCQDCSLSILKIDDDDELKFLQLQINPKRYWIGLSYDKSKRKWQWIDDSPLKLDLTVMRSLCKTGGSAFFSSPGKDNDDCATTHSFICENKVD